MKFDIGIFGLGVMGRNLALNFEDKGYIISGYDISTELIKKFTPEINKLDINLFTRLEDFVRSLKSPKIVLLMIKSGKPVDESIAKLSELMDNGDIIIDGGNSHYKHTISRYNLLKKKGIHFYGIGISGGEKGARLGPSLMPGGNIDIWDKIKLFFESIAARNHDGTLCCKWVGDDGAGHFIKMVHNGIEYGLMQVIAESIDILVNSHNYKINEVADLFVKWNEGKLNSYLMEITSKILMQKDEYNEGYLIEFISDIAGQKGTGNWCAKASLEYNVPTTTITAAVYHRNLSGLTNIRNLFQDKKEKHNISVRGSEMENIRDALYISSVIIYAQGFDLMKSASFEHGWQLKMKDIASIWRSGCIIRSSILEEIHSIIDNNDTNSIYKHFKTEIDILIQNLRKVVVKAITAKIPIPVHHSVVNYIDTLNQNKMATNIIQAQRDLFGSHGYERLDKVGKFHTNWDY